MLFTSGFCGKDCGNKRPSDPGSAYGGDGVVEGSGEGIVSVPTPHPISGDIGVHLFELIFLYPLGKYVVVQLLDCRVVLFLTF